MVLLMGRVEVGSHEIHVPGAVEVPQEVDTATPSTFDFGDFAAGALDKIFIDAGDRLMSKLVPPGRPTWPHNLHVEIPLDF